MTSPLLDSQLDCLKQSLAALVHVCADLPSGRELRELLTRLGPRWPGSEHPHAAVLGRPEALRLVAQARGSVDMLARFGYLGAEEGDGVAAQLEAGLEKLEKELAQEVRRRVSRRVHGLYVIIDPQVTGGRDPLEVARGALKGGARMIQLRDKLRDKGQTLLLARSLRAVCTDYGALLIINDHADLASVAGADGLHVGQSDLPVAEARRVLEPHQIVGRSNHLLYEVLESLSQGADHVALGNVYPTATKESIRRRPPLGPEAVKKAREAIDVPLVAIGGISEDNVEEVVRAGADAVCVASAVGLATDPEEASRRLVERIRRAGGKG